jgi:hypothetical protein
LLKIKRIPKPDGRFVLLGGGKESSGIGFVNNVVKVAVVSWFSSQTFQFMLAEISQPELVTLGGLVQSGKLTSVIDRRYSVEDVSEAMRCMETGHGRAKGVIKMGRRWLLVSPLGCTPFPRPRSGVQALFEVNAALTRRACAPGFAMQNRTSKKWFSIAPARTC